jgi:hypothetical protein
MTPKYRLRLRCPHGDFYDWIVTDDVGLTLDQIYRSEWDFVCPTHGPQRELPFQAEEKRPVSDP